MTLRALVVDDEPWPRVALATLLRERPGVEVVGEAHSVATAVDRIRALDPDVVFLDVRMRDGLGFDVLGQVEFSGHVVFVTAFDDHALRAFEVDALDYLLKPVRGDHLERALARLEQRRGDGLAPTSTARVVGSPRAVDESDAPLQVTDRICLHRGKDVVFAQVADILFLSAARDYTDVHLASGRAPTVKQSLAAWEARLPPVFFRIHRSTIVNLAFGQDLSLVDGRWELMLQGGKTRLLVSRRLAARLKQRLGAL
ncbi:MAG: LytTR family DNA-binding domain-containing protein [Myxococcota bacterium]